MPNPSPGGVRRGVNKPLETRFNGDSYPSLDRTLCVAVAKIPTMERFFGDS
jgi:hypothetical protein